jgi:phosphate starvation-inducible PhoH-like protein
MKRTLHFEFDDNAQGLEVFGPNESHLMYLKKNIPVSVKYRGNQVTVEGPEDSAQLFFQCLEFLRGLVRKGIVIALDDVMNCYRNNSREARPAGYVAETNNATTPTEGTPQHIIITSPHKSIYTRTPGQRSYVEAIQKNDIVFGVGPAGTGKTYLAMAVAMSRLIKGEVERIILTRPAVDAGENLGFLPGE